MNKTRTRLIDPPHGDFKQKPSRYKVPLTQRTQKRPGRQAFPKPARVREPEYLAWLHEQPCFIHGARCSGVLEVMHLSVFPGEKSMSSKVSDFLALPACREVHQKCGSSPSKVYEEFGIRVEPVIIRHFIDWMLEAE